MSNYVTLPRPEPPPWKSAWRMDFERRHAEDQLCPQVKRVAPKPSPRPRSASKPRKRRLKMRTLCQCGRVIKVKGRLWCCTCLDRPKQVGISPKCTVCGAALNWDNTRLLCRKHGNHGGPDRKVEREICRYSKGGMHCAQPLYRTNQSGLCRFHVPKPTKGTPHMIPQSSRKVAQP